VVRSEPRFPAGAWHEPCAEGWSPEGLAAVVRALEAQRGSTALMVVEDGRPVICWGDIARRSSVASVRKSLISLLFGIHVERGAIRLSSTLEELGIDDHLGLTRMERQATVADLLAARSGVYHPSVYDTSHGRPTRGTYAPGAFWFYNNWDFNVLGTIFERQTGQGVFDALLQDLALPLRMQDVGPGDGRYERGPESRHPVYKIRMSARDLARIGLLALRGGQWGRRRVVGQEWIEASTTPHSDLGGGRGYGLLWWTAEARAEGDALSGPHRLFYASGLGGQYVIVIPALALVVVHRAANVDDGIHHGHMGHLLRLVLAARRNQ
jgi:CubicO group peptidase (beta-lactamase class C family)